MNLHLIALPHTQVTPEFFGCAFTSNVWKFCKMMGREHEVFVYAPEGSSVPYATLVGCTTNKERFATFKTKDSSELISFPTDEQTLPFNKEVVEKLRERIKPRDLILSFAGWTHKPVMDAFPDHIFCEPGVGYLGIAAKYCAFPSYAWMHHVYVKKNINDGRWFDMVIPHYFDPDEFSQLNNGQGDYLLFLGRLVERKGPHIASEIAQRVGLPLIVAGAGGKQVGKDIVADAIITKSAKYVGFADVKERAELLSKAKALIVPTTYMEPFGCVVVEAMMCGTPVITTDWGAFPEIVQNGVSGFRFRTLAEAELAVRRLGELQSTKIREYALNRYSLSSVKPQFESWFKNLETLWADGWYTKLAA